MKTFIVYTMDFILMFLIVSSLFILIITGELVISCIMAIVFVIVANNYIVYRRIYLTGKC
jgi:hypothetical protein